MSHEHAYELPDVALRLVLIYRGGEVTLDQALRVRMRLLPSDDLPERMPQEPLSGFWYELQGDDGEILYRQITAHPIRSWAEIPDEEDPRGLVPVEFLPEEVVFTLVVPDVPRAKQLVLFSSPLDRPSASAPAEPLWVIPLEGIDPGEEVG